LVKSTCEYCGKVKEYKYPSLVKRFCSHRCARLGSPKPPAKKEILTCTHCNAEFELLSSERRAREKNGRKIKYCSKKCEGLAKRKRKSVNCKNCGNMFETTRNTFCSRECVAEYARKTGIRKKNGYWYENGYKVLYLEGDKSIKEHRKIMEEHLGRKLKPYEVVHHINGDRSDNRIENLEVMTRGEHSRLHRLQELQEGKRLFGS